MPGRRDRDSDKDQEAKGDHAILPALVTEIVSALRSSIRRVPGAKAAATARVAAACVLKVAAHIVETWKPSEVPEVSSTHVGQPQPGRAPIQ
jgi:hypothetical protein